MLKTREQILSYAIFQYRGFAKRAIKSIKEDKLIDPISFGCAVGFQATATAILGKKEKTSVNFLTRTLLKYQLNFRNTENAIQPKI